MKNMFKGVAPFAALSLVAVFTACSNTDSGSNAPLPIENPQGTSSAAVLPESSQIVIPESSQSALPGSSSFEEIASSSSAADGVLRVPAGGAFRWTAADDGARVITGLDNGSDYSGYWFTYDDNTDGGMSHVDWSVACPNNVPSEECYANAIEESKGVALSFTLEKGILTYSPFVGVGFNIAGVDGEAGNPVAADASTWGGLCVAYTSTHDISLELGFGDEMDAQIGYDNPSVKLPKSEEGAVKCTPWSSFRKWGVGTEPLEATKKLVAVKFKIQGANGTKGNFNIMSVGSYVQQASSEISSSSVKPSSSAATSPTSSSAAILRVPAGGLFSWAGSDEEYRVNTGLDNGSNTSGYWFTYADADDGGASQTRFPVETDYMGDDDAYAPVIEKCKGFCASFELNKGTLPYNPFVGFGFNIAGENEETRNPEAADASAWGGLCVAYTSTHDIALELGFGSAVDAEIGYDNPSVKMPKSEEGIVKCFRWSNFVKAGLDTDVATAAKKLVAVKFKIQGANGTKGNFNIMSVGSYVAQ